MNAGELAKKFGKRLIGRKIITEPYGDWPGGVATITELTPDPGAPEIVFQVVSNAILVRQATNRGALDSKSIGVFDHEDVTPIF